MFHTRHCLLTILIAPNCELAMKCCLFYSKKKRIVLCLCSGYQVQCVQKLSFEFDRKNGQKEWFFFIKAMLATIPWACHKTQILWLLISAQRGEDRVCGMETASLEVEIWEFLQITSACKCRGQDLFAQWGPMQSYVPVYPLSMYGKDLWLHICTSVTEHWAVLTGMSPSSVGGFLALSGRRVTLLALVLCGKRVSWSCWGKSYEALVPAPYLLFFCYHHLKKGKVGGGKQLMDLIMAGSGQGRHGAPNQLAIGQGSCVVVWKNSSLRYLFLKVYFSNCLIPWYIVHCPKNTDVAQLFFMADLTTSQ